MLISLFVKFFYKLFANSATRWVFQSIENLIGFCYTWNDFDTKKNSISGRNRDKAYKNTNIKYPEYSFEIDDF